MNKPVKPNEQNLADHAESWAAENGKTVPKRGTDEWDMMYNEWIEYAFEDFRGLPDDPDDPDETESTLHLELKMTNEEIEALFIASRINTYERCEINGISLNAVYKQIYDQIPKKFVKTT
jgi:hypothetical protein